MTQKKIDWGEFVADLYSRDHYKKEKLIASLIICVPLVLLLCIQIIFHEYSFLFQHYRILLFILFLVGMIYLFIAIYRDKKRRLEYGIDSNGQISEKSEWEKYMDWRTKEVAKSYIKSVVALAITAFVIYIFMEHVLKVENYDTNEVLIAVGIPMFVWILILIVSSYPIYIEDKKQKKELDPELKMKTEKYMKPLIILLGVILVLILLQFAIVCEVIPIPIHYSMYLILALFILTIPLFYLIIKLRNVAQTR